MEDLLKECTDDDCAKVMQLAYADLLNRLDSREVVPQLYSDETLNHIDKEEIEAEQNKGKRLGMEKLLAILAVRRKHGFLAFIEALVGRKDLLKMLEELIEKVLKDRRTCKNSAPYSGRVTASEGGLASVEPPYSARVTANEGGHVSVELVQLYFDDMLPDNVVECVVLSEGVFGIYFKNALALEKVLEQRQYHIDSDLILTVDKFDSISIEARPPEMQTCSSASHLTSLGLTNCASNGEDVIPRVKANDYQVITPFDELDCSDSRSRDSTACDDIARAVSTAVRLVIGFVDKAVTDYIKDGWRKEYEHLLKSCNCCVAQRQDWGQLLVLEYALPFPCPEAKVVVAWLRHISTSVKDFYSQFSATVVIVRKESWNLQLRNHLRVIAEEFFKVAGRLSILESAAQDKIVMLVGKSGDIESFAEKVECVINVQ